MGSWTTIKGTGTISGAETFVELTDVPSSYSGQGSKLVRVNAGATGLEFTDPRPPTQVVKASLSGDQTISTVASGAAGANMAQVSTWQASVTTTVTCDIKITVTFNTVATNADLVTGYQFNSETAVPMLYQNHPGTNVRHTLSFTDVVENVAAGTHTVKVMAARATANVTIYGSANPYYQAILVVEAIPVA